MTKDSDFILRVPGHPPTVLIRVSQHGGPLRARFLGWANPHQGVARVELHGRIRNALPVALSSLPALEARVATRNAFLHQEGFASAS